MSGNSARQNAGRRRPLVIAGTASGVGKTTVATGIMGAFRRRGLKVAPFKVGPDYIDPGYHREATGAVSRNLDTWLAPAEHVRVNFARGSAGSDVSVIEGVMGLFDGRAGAGGQGSTAEVARLVDGVVVLVVDCTSLSRSLAPVLAGFASFDEHVEIAGVILNNAGSARHAAMLLDAASEAGMPVLGVLDRKPSVKLDSRHLGLVPTAEADRSQTLERIAEHIENGVDLDNLLELALTGEPWPAEVPAKRGQAGSRSGVKLAVARDEAFSFYYADGLESLEAAGADMVYFSPLHDAGLPACDGIYLGGGFPEMFAGGLEANVSMRGAVAAAVGDGMPVYAECGGLVYLCRDVEVEGKRLKLAGALPLRARMCDRRQALGYVEATAAGDSILFRSGDVVRGHEFHWSGIEWRDDSLAYTCRSSRSPGERREGYRSVSVLASYVHMNFAGNAEASARFIDACMKARGAVADAARR